MLNVVLPWSTVQVSDAGDGAAGVALLAAAAAFTAKYEVVAVLALLLNGDWYCGSRLPDGTVGSSDQVAPVGVFAA
jgi:hypothetical protein